MEEPNTIPESEITAQRESLAKSVGTFFKKLGQTFLDVCVILGNSDHLTGIACDKFFREIYDAIDKRVKERGRPLDESEKEELAELKRLHKLMKESESKDLQYLMRSDMWRRQENRKKKVPPLSQYQRYNLYNCARDLEDLLNKTEK